MYGPLVTKSFPVEKEGPEGGLRSHQNYRSHIEVWSPMRSVDLSISPNGETRNVYVLDLFKISDSSKS